MQPAGRLHALDGLRAAALLLGVVLHAAMPYVPGSGWMTQEAPSRTLELLDYTIHLFRMPLFFMIAGFFGRMLLESRGLKGFLTDRSRRILVPLVAGLPLIMGVTGAAFMLGAFAAGQSPAMAVPAAAAHPGGVSINLIHLWFLYYLLIFYAAALGVRGVCSSVSGLSVRLRGALDTAVRTLAGAPVILTLPVILYWSCLPGGRWGGWPAPFSLVPETGALLGYGAYFAFGWLLHRHQGYLGTATQRWPAFISAAVLMWLACRMLGDAAGAGAAHVAYTACYVLGAWCASLGLLGVSLRFLSGYSPMQRYLADASYWIYLMHIAALLFFQQLLHPLHLPWMLKYPLSMAAAMLFLLTSYHGLVRFTLIGAILNGRRHPRGSSEPEPGRSASRGPLSPG
jgi:glucans biosynthesis protein C